MSDSLFEQLESSMQDGGVEAVLTQLITGLKQEKKYHELFEALKMQVRHSIGLPLLYGESGDELEASQRNALEDGLISACRQVGMGLLQEGRISEGYMYMRPVGDRQAVKEILDQVQAGDNNLDELVEVLLQEGVDVERGFQIVLDSYGTCNSITTYETVVAHKSKPEQRKVAKLLLDHVHAELLNNVKSDIANRSESEPEETTLQDLVADREWLFGEHAYHIDTTHLASTTRFSRILEEEACLRKALDLTYYGRMLNSQFQYEGDEPFTDIYPDHALYYQALLGENVEDALAHFRQKANDVPRNQWGTLAVEVYIDLLNRIGQVDQAIAATAELIQPGERTGGLAPSLLELCESKGDYSQLVESCRGANDVLGFATGLMKAKTS
ncbi:MAG: hypothetical protein CMJ76_04170 [Planctomycetaceae bacterium]|nr:hypothetical protein [Planctomycetaceae bacterium]